MKRFLYVFIILTIFSSCANPRGEGLTSSAPENNSSDSYTDYGALEKSAYITQLLEANGYEGYGEIQMFCVDIEMQKTVYTFSASKAGKTVVAVCSANTQEETGSAEIFSGELLAKANCSFRDVYTENTGRRALVKTETYKLRKSEGYEIEVILDCFSYPPDKNAVENSLVKLTKNNETVYEFITIGYLGYDIISENSFFLEGEEREYIEYKYKLRMYTNE